MYSALQTMMTSANSSYPQDTARTVPMIAESAVRDQVTGRITQQQLEEVDRQAQAQFYEQQERAHTLTTQQSVDVIGRLQKVKDWASSHQNRILNARKVGAVEQFLPFDLRELEGYVAQLGAQRGPFHLTFITGKYGEHDTMTIQTESELRHSLLEDAGNEDRGACFQRRLKVAPLDDLMVYAVKQGEKQIKEGWRHGCIAVVEGGRCFKGLEESSLPRSPDAEEREELDAGEVLQAEADYGACRLAVERALVSKDYAAWFAAKNQVQELQTRQPPLVLRLKLGKLMDQLQAE
jgi:hypothetical protein